MPQVKLISPLTKQTVKKLRVAAYCRVSSNSADQLNSYATQIRVYTKKIKQNPEWELVDIFADEGISGTNAENRPEFQRMIRMCELRQIDLIIAKSISRFARNTKETLEYTRKLKLIGVGVVFEKEGINTLSLGDEMLLNTFAAIAQEESQAISQNLRLANKKRMENGEYISSHVPYGFRLINKETVIYEPEAVIVRKIFMDYLNGKSTTEIAKELTASKTPTKYGNEQWSHTGIVYILTNERYIGDSLYQKKYRTPTVPFTLHMNKGEEDMYYATGTHKPLIEKEMFDKAQALIQSRRKRFAKMEKTNTYPLTSRIRCSECGSFFNRKVRKGGIKWACSTHCENSKACDSFYYSEERIYDGFIAMVNKLRFGAENIIGQTISMLETAANTYKMNNQLARDISQSIAELNAKLLMLDQLQGKGYLAGDVYQIQARDIKKQISKLKSQRQNSYESKILETLVDVRKIKCLLDEIEEPLEEFDQKLFEQIVCGMTLNRKDELTITLIGGLKFTELI